MKKSKRKVKVQMTLTFGADYLSLHDNECIPCKGGVPPLTESQIKPLLSQLDSDWNVIEQHHLERVWKFEDFKTALGFVNAAGNICENQGHHADFELGWGRVKVSIWTHKIDGLTESDFFLAAKMNQI
jgi:4a-hydroxytetrahydrobiopterin dehydratase